MVSMASGDPSPKDQLRSVLDAQPDDSSIEELLRELAFACMVERGLADAEAGRVVEHDALRADIETWRK